jgi:hypothetical protein
MLEPPWIVCPAAACTVMGLLLEQVPSSFENS